MEDFAAFLDAVKHQLNRATEKEAASFLEELAAHLEDHTEALTESGWPVEEARNRAVEAMGDPAAIGRDWNAQLSRFWLWLKRICQGLLLLTVLTLIMPLLLSGSILVDNLTARFFPLKGGDYQLGSTQNAVWQEWEPILLDGGEYMISIYRIGLGKDENGAYICVSSCVYNKNPLGPAPDNLLQSITVNGRSGGGGGSSSGGAAYWTNVIQVEPDIPSATLELSWYGMELSTEIPLKWEVLS